MSDISCLEFISEIRDSYPATLPVQLGFNGVNILVQTNDSRLCKILNEYFSEFVAGPGSRFHPSAIISAHEAPAPDISGTFTEKQPDPGKNKIKEEYIDCEDGRIVRKRLTGMVLAFSGQKNMAVGPCVANANQVVNFINNRLIAYHLNSGCYLGHAAAVSHNDKGLAIAGFSGMGKSTLALFLMNEGCSFVSNDRVMLSEDLPATLHGVPKHPRINPGTALNNERLEGIIDPEDREYFKSLPPDELWSLEHKYDALINQCYGPHRFVLRAPFSGLAVLNWKRNDGETIVKEVNPFERLDLVEAFSKETGLFYMPDEDAGIRLPTLMDYAQRLSQAPLIEISGGVNFATAARECLNFLNR